ncbi:MAG: hypothetical protein DRP56_01345 [Planctomycetota bacterium]|nr:MAG: hypothetical protein DRP56_01345 [Planctomycetota bacterium]
MNAFKVIRNLTNMGRRESYEKAKARLLSDRNTCKENRDLWKRFFEWEERKLKRTNNLARLDDATYKTLSHYVGRFKNVNKWFHGKAWKDLTKDGIQKVYDDLEDGVIKNRFGKPYADRKSYYTKIFKAKPFKMAGKSEIVEDVFEFFRPTENSEVNFIESGNFKKLATATNTLSQKLLLWLAWDVGENIMSLLQLRKRDFRRQINPETGEPEYLVDLRKEILKRSRTPRVEITLYIETVELLDIALGDMKSDNLLFSFGQRQAGKFMSQCVNATHVKCAPSGKGPTFKDLRSSMCCYLLKEGWRIEEVNSRLGHSPNNLSMVSRYANYLALDKHKPKRKLSANMMQSTKEALEESKKTVRLYEMRFKDQQDRVKNLEKGREQTNILIKELMKKVSELQSSLKMSMSLSSAC